MERVDTNAPWCVGREPELQRLQSAIDATAAGHGRLVLVGGEAGIGKTRLAEATAAAAAGEGFRTVWGRCWEAGGAPAYWPWIEAIRGLLAPADRGVLATAAPPQARAAVRLVRSWPRRWGSRTPMRRTRRRRGSRFSTALRRSCWPRQTPARSCSCWRTCTPRTPRPLLLLDLLAPRLGDAALLVLATHREGDPNAAANVERLIARLARVGERVTLRGLDLGHAPARTTQTAQRREGRLPSANSERRSGGAGGARPSA